MCETELRELSEEEALSAVVRSLRTLFPMVTERQSRELSRAVIRDLEGGGVVLARRDGGPRDRGPGLGAG